MKKLLFVSIFAIALTVVASATTPAQAPTPSPTPAPSQNKSVAGEWDASFNTPGGPQAFKLIFAVDGEKLSGTAKRTRGDVPLVGTIKSEDISFAYTVNYNGNDLTIGFTGKVKVDSMSGTVSFGGQAEDSWSATRIPAEKPKTDKP